MYMYISDVHLHLLHYYYLLLNSFHHQGYKNNWGSGKTPEL